MFGSNKNTDAGSKSNESGKNTDAENKDTGSENIKPAVTTADPRDAQIGQLEKALEVTTGSLKNANEELDQLKGKNSSLKIALEDKNREVPGKVVGKIGNKNYTFKMPSFRLLDGRVIKAVEAAEDEKLMKELVADFGHVFE